MSPLETEVHTGWGGGMANECRDILIKEVVLTVARGPQAARLSSLSSPVRTF